MTDILKAFPVDHVHRWYNRLADAALARKITGKDPLSGLMLKTYVTNKVKDQEYSFPAHDYLQQNNKVRDALAFHRRVFLTEEKARLGRGGNTLKWAGLIPRLQDGRWDGKSDIDLYYESLVSIGANLAEIIRIQTSGTQEEMDLFTSLRGFQMRSDVIFSGIPAGKLVQVSVKSWQVTALDRYDFNYSEHLTLPNPDHGSTDPDAIRPDLEKIKVYHTNAKRMVDKGLAAPFKVRIGPWKPTDPALSAGSRIDPAKRLP
jgi:hypothetical protein